MVKIPRFATLSGRFLESEKILPDKIQLSGKSEKISPDKNQCNNMKSYG